MGRVGPDAARYLIAGRGYPVARPFNLRWLLPAVCGDDLRLWRAIWFASWPVIALAAFWWAHGVADGWVVPTAAAALTVALPGLLAARIFDREIVDVDLPALAVTLAAAAFWSNGYEPIAIVLAVWAATVKELQPVWLALWVWSPWPLVALVAPLVAAVLRRPAIDEVTAEKNLREIHDHPIRTALEAHAGRWRDGWLMVAPWGACLAAFWQPSSQVVAVTAAAYAQLLVATDTVRLLHVTAGPVLALAAAQTIPTEWLPLAVLVGSVMWWRKPEVV